MAAVNLCVKWNKEKYDLSVDLNDSPEVFKAQLFALTNVPPERQKIMFKGKILADDSWNIAPTNGAQLMMMGSSDPLPTKPKTTTKFMEDMSEGELGKILEMPAGLLNLGNTCYMNATLQCLKSVKEFTDAIVNYDSSHSNTNNSDAQMLTAAVKNTFARMEGTQSAQIEPLAMLLTLHRVFPRFAEKGERGGFQQQDANECWIELLRMLKDTLPPKQGLESVSNGEAENMDSTNTDSNAASSSAHKSHSNAKSLIQQYFGGVFDVTMKCKESDSEPETHTNEDFLQLSCFLSQEVKYLHSGLKARLHDDIIKRSAVLERDALFEKTMRLSRIPAYLTINIVRFQFKGGEKATSAKILKDVKFPLMLDVYDLCAPDLQEKLLPMRRYFKALGDWTAVNIGKNDDIKSDEDAITRPFSFENDVGSNNSGFYELQAVLTHKGRTSNSGHYVAWVKRGKSWLMCDDENITPVTEDDVLKLSGGGDWHCAYVLLYGPRVLRAPKNLDLDVLVAKSDVSNVTKTQKESPSSEDKKTEKMET